MILEIKNKKIELTYKTRKIVQLTKELKGKNFEELYFNSISENNIEALAEIILVFAEDKNTGLNVFKNIEEVYDFIDDYMLENKKTYQEIFKEIAEDINNQGFFNSKMTEEELINKINSHISIDMNQIIKDSAEKAITQIAQNEMKISKG